MTRRPFKYVPFVLCTTGILVCLLAGCRKEAEKPAIPASSPESYMKDPVFREQLSTKRKELQRIVMERKPLADRMQELVREHGEDLAALQKIAEWTNLYEKVTALNKRYEELSKQQIKVLRNRITPTKEISK